MRKLCVSIIIAISFLAPWLFVSALGPFQFGIWFQSEPVTFALFIISAVLSLCFIPLLRSHHLIELWKKPLFLALWGLSLWSIAISYTASYPLRSLMGTPEIGQGALWFLCLALLTSAYQLTLQNKRWHIALLANLVLAGLVSTFLQSSFTDPYWLPSKWPDYLGFVGFCLFITLIMLAPWQELKHRVGYFLLCGSILLFSDSLLAIALYWAVIPLVIFAFTKFPYLRNKKVHKSLLFSGALVPLIYSLSCFFPEIYQNFYHSLTNATDTKAAELAFYNSSTGTRILFSSIVWEAMFANPIHWLTGTGWGHYIDALFEHVFVANVSNTIDNTQHSNWVYTSGSAFHSHNNYLEALYSTGLIGLGFLLSIAFLAIRQLSHRKLIWAGTSWMCLSLMLGAWFMLTICIAFIAAALAAIIHTPPDSNRTIQWNFPATLMAFTLLLTSAGLVLAATYHYQDANAGRAYMDSIRTSQPDSATLLPQNNHRLWWAALNLADYLQKKQQTPQISFTSEQTDIAWFSEILNQLDTQLPEGKTNTRLRSLRAHMVNDLMVFYQGAHWDDLRAKAAVNWHNVLWSSIKAHPTRGDIAAPYYQYFLNQMLAANSIEQQQAPANSLFLLSETVLQNFPNEPTALWFSGKALEFLGDKTGPLRMQKALKFGAPKRFPIF